MVQRMVDQTKAISLRAPWWFAVLHLGKTIENRRWSTRYRGPILLHASRSFIAADIAADLAAIAIIAPTRQLPEMETLRALGGHLVGRARIVDCVRDSASPWFCGPFGLVLADIEPLDPPRFYRGAQGLFPVDP